MEPATYPTAVAALQQAIESGHESAIRQAVSQCLLSGEVIAYPVLAGGVYLTAGHYFLQTKQYVQARTLYQQGQHVFCEALAANVPGAEWLRVQAMLCEAQTYDRAGKRPQALLVWQQTHQYASTLPDPSPLAVEVAIRLAEAYLRDGQRRQASIRFEEAMTLAAELPRPLCPVPLLAVLDKKYLPLLDTTPDRRRFQERMQALLAMSPTHPSA
ncbi:hypothetical protein [Fibrivirga algicola]|uniref:Tetratricopeptide repeat protein n=1 Tax=Fibrivirga algicola TaxID=2950420 RepID=A0ABX0QIW7_9BACT|nr:hypothetical protein [Fibrivirga algicola]NID10798.1 hypothetical protein [Fibrivirga algicola]